jgi:hypothetical protein
MRECGKFAYDAALKDREKRQAGTPVLLAAGEARLRGLNPDVETQQRASILNSRTYSDGLGELR